jgi:hypothetical protein
MRPDEGDYFQQRLLRDRGTTGCEKWKNAEKWKNGVSSFFENGRKWCQFIFSTAPGAEKMN